MSARVERDSLGEVRVPSSALYGAQTQRALENFPVSGRGPHSDFVWATVVVKKGAALANMRSGLLAEDLGNAILRASDEILEQGWWLDQFVVDRYQAGAGTSHNMNANEVLANRANELLGARRGDYRPVHPNDHVNMAQSSNDSVPTMVRLGALRGWGSLRIELEALADAFGQKAREFDQVVKTGRTHLQDAVPIRLGQEFHAYRTTVAKAMESVDDAARGLHTLNIGATAVGTGINASETYRRDVIDELRGLTGWELHAPGDYFQITQSLDDFVRFSGALRGLAIELGKMADDLRLLSSGPRSGFGDIELPPVQPGSSIMPGKVNPVMPEMLNMVCFRVAAGDTAVSLAAMHGELDLNVFAPVIADVIPESLTLLRDSVSVFTERCVRGILAREGRLAELVARNTALATALAPHIGYERAARVAQKAVEEGLTIREAALAQGVAEAEVLDRILDARRLTEPGPLEPGSDARLRQD